MDIYIAYLLVILLGATVGLLRFHPWHRLRPATLVSIDRRRAANFAYMSMAFNLVWGTLFVGYVLLFNLSEPSLAASEQALQSRAYEELEAFNQTIDTAQWVALMCGILGALFFLVSEPVPDTGRRGNVLWGAGGGLVAGFFGFLVFGTFFQEEVRGILFGSEGLKLLVDAFFSLAR